MLMWYLWPEDFQRLAIYCLSHDVPEAWFGDIPSPTLRFVPGIRDKLERLEGMVNEGLGLPPEHELNEEDMAKLKACDRLELYIWCQEQLLLGNQYAAEILMELDFYFEMKALPDRAMDLYIQLKHTPMTVPRLAGVVRELVGTDAA